MKEHAHECTVCREMFDCESRFGCYVECSSCKRAIQDADEPTRKLIKALNDRLTKLEDRYYEA